MRTAQSVLVAATAAANATPIVVNPRQNPFNVGLVLSHTGSTTGWTVQYTMDDLEDIAAASATWVNTSIAAYTTAANTGIALTIPCYGVRLQCDANGTDTGTLTVTQAG